MNLAEVSKEQDIPTSSGKNYTAVHTGKFGGLLQYKLQHPAREKPVRGKLFLKDHLGLTGMQVSLNTLPAGIAVPFSHKHKKNEELYIFVKGRGQIQIDGDIIDVEEGTAVRVAPDGERTWRNNSEEDLHYVVIQAAENSLTQDTFDDGIPGSSAPVWPAT